MALEGDEQIPPSYEDLVPHPWTPGYVHIIRYDYRQNNNSEPALTRIKYHVCHGHNKYHLTGPDTSHFTGFRARKLVYFHEHTNGQARMIVALLRIIYEATNKSVMMHNAGFTTQFVDNISNKYYSDQFTAFRRYWQYIVGSYLNGDGIDVPNTDQALDIVGFVGEKIDLTQAPWVGYSIRPLQI